MLLNSKTIFDSITKQIGSLYEEGETHSIAYLLLEELLGVSKTDILLHKSIPFESEKEDQLKAAVLRLKAHEPIQYVLGKTMFYGLSFQVNKQVLIPRQETEELVDWVVKSHQKKINILDIGTGSGCIAISLALQMEGKVVAWDVSKQALAVAKQNARDLHAKVEFEKTDVLGKINPKRKFDLIVANPPYVLETEKVDMPSNVMMYEPHLALFVDDHDPLIFYHRIMEIAMNLLSENGWLYFEINENYGLQVAQLMQRGGFDQVEIRKDLNGKERMIRGCLATTGEGQTSP